mgnify:CR=1 FL=1
MERWNYEIRIQKKCQQPEGILDTDLHKLGAENVQRRWLCRCSSSDSDHNYFMLVTMVSADLLLQNYCKNPHRQDTHLQDR